MARKFRTLMDGDDYMAVSPKLNNGDFDYWLVLECKDLQWAVSEQEMKEMGGRWLVTLKAVSPDEAGESNVLAAESCCGIEDEDTDILTKVQCLAEYGVFAPIYEKVGKNMRQLLREARQQAVCAESLFGFYMDRQVNRIGNSGWDAIAGNIGFH